MQGLRVTRVQNSAAPFIQVLGFQKHLPKASKLLKRSLPDHTFFSVILDPKKMGSPCSRPRVYMLLATLPA